MTSGFSAFPLESDPGSVAGPPSEPTSADRWTTWDDGDVLRGPEPWPDWLVTTGDAHDEELGILKTGKEADVFLLRRASADSSCLLAAKRYRSSEHRLFHRDGSYVVGRRVRKSRETRAMARRTGFGKQLLAGRWALYEWTTLCEMYGTGLPVPYPVSCDSDEILMEFIEVDGAAAPRLVSCRPGPDELQDLFAQFRGVVLTLAGRHQAHGDLSPYNCLVRDGELVVIDWPQIVDIIANPEGMSFLQRDVEVMCRWFSARGLDVDAGEVMGQAVAQI